MALCLHGWVDEDGCAESCDGPQEIAGYCEMHAEFHGEEMVDEIARLRAELEEARSTVTLRDQFAMSVVEGELSSQSREWGGYPPGDEARFAERVWRLTDALLARRSGKRL